MKLFNGVILLAIFVTSTVKAETFDEKHFAQQYFAAWTATQAPNATKQDIENYLALLVDDIGHQHLPYDKDDTRDADGKKSMRKGMLYYLGAHSKYQAELVSVTYGLDVIIIKYTTASSGYHPQLKETVHFNYDTVEVLELVQGKVSVVRKYSE
jgi:hypothetical protein